MIRVSNPTYELRGSKQSILVDGWRQPAHQRGGHQFFGHHPCVFDGMAPTVVATPAQLFHRNAAGRGLSGLDTACARTRSGVAVVSGVSGRSGRVHDSRKAHAVASLPRRGLRSPCHFRRARPGGRCHAQFRGWYLDRGHISHVRSAGDRHVAGRHVARGASGVGGTLPSSCTTATRRGVR